MTKHLVHATDSTGAKSDPQWLAAQGLPVIPSYPEFASMIEAGDVVELHCMRQRAVFYKALAEGYAGDVVEKNAEIERLKDKLVGVNTDDITNG